MTIAAVARTTTLPLRVPWTTLLVASAFAGLTTLLALTLPESISPLTTHLAELALAGSAAYLLDDVSAQLTTVAPRSVWRRRAFPLGVGLAGIAVAWGVVLLALGRTPGTPRAALTLEVVVLVSVTLAASAVLAAHGEPEPGSQVAVAVPLAGVATILAGSLSKVDLFVSGHAASQAGWAWAWAACGVLALVVTVLASRDRPS